MDLIEPTIRTARFVKRLKGAKGSEWPNARLYELSEPVVYDEPAKTTSFVVVSAAVSLFTGSEIYILPADKDGNVLDWGGLPGSSRGHLDHQMALTDMGYKVTDTIGPDLYWELVEFVDTVQDMTRESLVAEAERLRERIGPHGEATKL